MRRGAAMDELRRFMFEHVYLGETARPSTSGSRPCSSAGLLDHYERFPEQLPPAWPCQTSLHERIIDWVAGMTDGYAVRTFVELTVPRAFDQS